MKHTALFRTFFPNFPKAAAFLTAAVLAAALLAGCGSEDSGKYAGSSAVTAEGSYNSSGNEAAYDIQDSSVPESGAAAESVMEPDSASGRKIVYTASLSLESTGFDDARAALLDAADRCGGYLQYTDQSGSAEQQSRRATFTVRVPAARYREFLTDAGEAGNQLSLTETAEDITLNYVDVEARIDTLKTQRDRLNALAEKAETTADLLEIESQLSNVQYELERYTRQLRSMADQVQYSTVDIYLREVATLTPRGVTFRERLGDALTGGWGDFVSGLQDLAVTLVYLMPTLVLLAVVAVCVVAARRAWRKKHPKQPRPARRAAAAYPLAAPGAAGKPAPTYAADANAAPVQAPEEQPDAGEPGGKTGR